MDEDEARMAGEDLENLPSDEDPGDHYRLAEIIETASRLETGNVIPSRALIQKIDEIHEKIVLTRKEENIIVKNAAKELPTMISVLLMRKFLPQIKLTEGAQAVAVLLEGLLAADPGQDLQLCLPMPAQVTSGENENKEWGVALQDRDNVRGERSKNVAMEFLHGEAVAGPRLEPAQGGLLSEDRLDRSVVLQPAPSYVTPNEGRTPNADNVDNEDPDMPPLESSDEVGLPEVPVDGASANAKYLDERNLCIICQDTIMLDEQETVKLSCMHTFHLTCGTNWLQKDPRCPTCRDPVSSNNRGIITRPGNPLPMHICFSRGAYLSTSIHHRPPIRIAAAEGVNLSVTTENATGMRGNVGGRINSRPETDHQRRYTENRTESYMETRNSTRVPPCAPISQRRPRRNRPHRRSRNRQAPPTQPLNGMDAYLNGIEEGRRLTNQETGSSRMAEAAIKMFILFLMYMLVANRGQVNAASLNAIDPSASRSQAEITKYRAADILLYESHPRQIAPCLTSESVDVSILDTIQSELDDLLEYAKNLGKDTRVSVGQAEHYCPPAYPRQLTDALDSTILMPHYAEILENPVRPNKVFIVSLYKDKNIRSCNYSLTQHTTYHLQASHGSGTDAYYYSREAMYNNYKRWLVNNKGEKCIDKLDVYRGEIIEKETIRRMIVPHVESGLYGCAESCRSINNLIKGRRNRDNCLTKDCGKIDDRMCRAFSYNWRTELCRHSDRHNPERDNSYHYGFNALTTSERCLSAIQHTEALIMVNNTMAN